MKNEAEQKNFFGWIN